MRRVKRQNKRRVQSLVVSVLIQLIRGQLLLFSTPYVEVTRARPLVGRRDIAVSWSSYVAPSKHQGPMLRIGQYDSP